MMEDQRFAASRPDVLVYQTDVLDKDVTIAGNVMADLFVATTGTDADFVVKVIDVYPDDAPNNSPITILKWVVSRCWCVAKLCVQNSEQLR
jgi:predicted acyl esterase